MQVKAVEPDAVVIQAKGSDALERIEYGTCVWTTGVRMNPFTELLIQKLAGAPPHLPLQEPCSNLGGNGLLRRSSYGDCKLSKRTCCT